MSIEQNGVTTVLEDTVTFDVKPIREGTLSSGMSYDEINDYRDFCGHVDRLKFRDFALRLFDKGIYMNPSATLHSLSSVVHTEEDIAVTAKAIAEVLDEMD